MPSFSGGTKTQIGAWVVHEFTAGGTLTVVEAGTVDRVVIIGGGGGGGDGSSAGGGGAGELLELVDVTITTAVTVTIGAGGVGEQNGAPSSFGAFGTALGGGRGDGNSIGQPGACGGGGGATNSSNDGGAGSVGGDGGRGIGSSTGSRRRGGGGGGMTGNGQDGAFDAYPGGGGPGSTVTMPPGWADLAVCGGGQGSGADNGGSTHATNGGLYGGALQGGTAVANSGAGGGGNLGTGSAGLVLVMYELPGTFIVTEVTAEAALTVALSSTLSRRNAPRRSLIWSHDLTGARKGAIR